jgi:hypothetical protein
LVTSQTPRATAKNVDESPRTPTMVLLGAD